MKKSKNVTLVIGMACIVSIIPWSVVRSVIFISGVIDPAQGMRFFINNTLIVSLAAVLLLILPTILFVRNIKNKSVKWSPIASTVITSTFLCYELYTTINAFRQLYPAFLIVNEAAMRRVHLEQLMHIVKSGQLLLFIGSIFIIIGSVLSLLNNIKKRPHDP